MKALPYFKIFLKYYYIFFRLIYNMRHAKISLFNLAYMPVVGRKYKKYSTPVRACVTPAHSNLAGILEYPSIPP